MAVTIKQEKIDEVIVDANEVESKILSLCGEFPKGITDAIIQNSIPECDVKTRVTVINKLLSTGKIDLLQSGNQLIYRLTAAEQPGQFKGSDHQEKIVYHIIQDAGNKGIWIRDIRMKSNLVLTIVNKILKSLETKKLIKAVKSVAASRKKVYMLFDLEPDRSVTGGAWYNDQDFESEFVTVLNQQCFKYLQQKMVTAQDTSTDPIVQRNSSYAPSDEVTKFISQLGISKVELGVEDIETILDTLIYDGKVERTVVAMADPAGGPIQKKLYRAVNCPIDPTGLMRLPCGACPVYSECTESGVVSPSTCVYMKEWLDS